MASYTLYATDALNTTIQESLVKESVGDLVSNLFPLDTPLQQTLAKVDMDRESMQFPIDTFSSSLISRVATRFAASASFATTSAKPEGFTYTDITPQYPARLTSVAEIQGSQFSVSDSDRGVPMYGIADRFAYEALKHVQTLVNQFEFSLWWSPGTVPAGADFNTTGGDPQQIARQTQGLVHWIFKSGLERSRIAVNAASFLDGNGNQFGTNGGQALVDAKAWAYDAGGLALDQAMFKDNLMAQWWNLTGRQAGAIAFTGPKIKNFFSQFALYANGSVNERTIEAAAKRVTDTVDYYETDFGTIALNLSRYLNISGQSATITQSTGSIVVPYDEVFLAIQPQYFKIGVRRPVYMSPLGKVGDFERGLVRGEMGMLCMNPSGGSGISNCVP